MVVKHSSALRVIVASAVLALALLLVAPPVEAQKTKGKTRPAATKYLMRGISQAHCKAVADLLKDKGPADDKQWEQLVCHSTILNELSFVLMDDGRCPDKDWAVAAKTLRECSAKVVEAAKAKNQADAAAAFKGVTGACASCHAVHRPKS